MNRRILYMILVCCSFVLSLHAQIDVNWLLIARNSGSLVTPDGNNVRMMGFAPSLSAAIPVPGPTLYCEEGDSVKLTVLNMSQGAPHTVHLHGLDVNTPNDGVPNLSFQIAHTEEGYYYFKAPHPGTYIYHCHVQSPIHVQGGMYGIIIIRPAGSSNLTWQGGYNFDKEYAWTLSELDTVWHLDTFLMQPHDSITHAAFIPDFFEPQFFMVNGNMLSDITADSATAITASVNETVLLRLVNIGFHLNYYVFPPGLNAMVIASDGRPLPAPYTTDTLWIFTGERYELLLQPNAEFEDSICVEYRDMNTHEQKFTQCIPVSVNGFFGFPAANGSEKLRVYPNPASGTLWVNSGYEGSSYTIMDTKGTVVQSGLVTSGQILIDPIFPATYILKVYHPHGPLQCLFVKY